MFGQGLGVVCRIGWRDSLDLTDYLRSLIAYYSTYLHHAPESQNVFEFSVLTWFLVSILSSSPSQVYKNHLECTLVYDVRVRSPNLRYWMVNYIYVVYELYYCLSITSFKYSSKTSFVIFNFLWLWQFCEHFCTKITDTSLISCP